ncbi:hypothetical protein LCGC14_0832340 [marine sediment metagenome]|uniref:Uncharacterized protein n=1 Tax=marine sediment metagenome TaxID=412755 RepID=A0A0F9PFK2_9ZZZZ
MARFEKVALANGAPGTASNVEKLRDKFVQAEGGFGGSLDVQGSVDGTNFRVVLAAVAAGSITALPETLKEVRLDTTNATGGPAEVVLGGFNERVS